MKSMKYNKINEPIPLLPAAYDPNRLLNALRQRMGLEQDSELAQRLKIDEDVLLKLRDRRLRISPSMLVLMGEATGLSVPELRHLLNDRRQSYQMGYGHGNRRR